MTDLIALLYCLGTGEYYLPPFDALEAQTDETYLVHLVVFEEALLRDAGENHLLQLALVQDRKNRQMLNHRHHLALYHPDGKHLA
jgi:hypothetical protein